MRNIISNEKGFTLVELMMVVAIIYVLMAAALQEYIPHLNKAKVTSIAGPMTTLKAEIMTYYAINGTWPESREESAKIPLMGGIPNVKQKRIKEAVVRNGAIDFIFEDEMAGKVLTLHPAQPVGATFGPIIWVAGSGKDRSDWKIEGRDRTNFKENSIPKYMK